MRLYKDGKVVHRSYHNDEDDALETWRRAKQVQAVTIIEPPKLVDEPTISNLLDALLQPS